MIFIDLIIIGLVCVLCTDKLNVFEEMYNTFIKLLLKNAPYVTLGKPFSCSLCMTFWLGLLYIILSAYTVTLYNVALLLVIAYSTQYIYMLIDVIDHYIVKIIRWLMSK